MPISNQVSTAPEQERLRPYTHHGVHLEVNGKHAVGDCCFCGREGKFSVAIDTGLWRCFVCGAGTTSGGGNALTFIRLLHERSMEATVSAGGPAYLAEMAEDRRLCDPATLASWGVCNSIVGGTWLVPGYGTDGKLDQLYRRIKIPDSNGEWGWKLLPTPGIWPEGKVHALHLPVGDFDPSIPTIDVCEGPWDGMALWEVARAANLAPTTIIAVPGCNQWRDEWTDLCAGKNVRLWFDSDHPRTYGPNSNSSKISRPGFDGMVRVAKRLSGRAVSVQWLRWGPEGYDPERPDGWDIRDHLSQGLGNVIERRLFLNELLGKMEHAPAEWFSSTALTNGRLAHGVNGSGPDVEPESCDTFLKCEEAWADALEWRKELSDVIAVMLAVAASTNQAGDNQLLLQVIGDPGSAKTRMCKGLLVSNTCKLVLHLKSFHSGYKGEDGKDVSFVSRINGMCLVTPEADALSIGLSWDQLNSQMRQIFDGESAHTYGNSSVDMHYKGLRSPWIQAGTPALMDKDQSRLGDRFLRIRIEKPTEETKQAILLRALRNERAAVIETSNGTEASIIPPKLRKAYALTGGYVNWLRANIEEQIALVDMDEAAEKCCVDLAMLTADMRARPNMDPRKHEVHHTKEIPSRLVAQFGRLALCLAVVLNKKTIDTEILRIVKKVALDTSHGHTLNITQWMCCKNPRSAEGHNYQETGGLMETVLCTWTRMTKDKMTNYLMFLQSIDVLEFNHINQKGGAWKLTDRVYDLYLRVVGG